MRYWSCNDHLDIEEVSPYHVAHSWNPNDILSSMSLLWWLFALKKVGCPTQSSQVRLIKGFDSKAKSALCWEMLGKRLPVDLRCV